MGMPERARDAKFQQESAARQSWPIWRTPVELIGSEVGIAR